MATPKILSRLRLDWPLLGKELIEQAARKQMYVMRVTYALVLIGAFCFYYARHLAEGPVMVLGRGMTAFSFLAGAQFFTIFLFLPPLMAGAIAQEKERDTLGLLFLTDLTPWEFVLQKYVGRLIPMMTLLFLSLPLLAVAYSLGGVPISVLLSTAETLFFTCIAVGALALECSAHQATTFQALVRCWGFCLVFATCCWAEPSRFWFGLLIPVGAFMPLPLTFAIPLILTPISYLVPTFLFLLRAKQNLEARAFIQRRNPFGQQFKQLDQYWKDTRKLSRAILRKRDQEAYVIAKQVVRTHAGWSGDDWSLSEFLLAKMQVPNLLAFAIILGFIVFIILFFGVVYDPKSAPFYLIVDAIWLLALLTIPIQSANAVASERMNERLGPILTTPLTSTEILNEWLVPVRRWIQFITRPLMVVFVLDAMIKFHSQDPRGPRLNNLVAYLGICLLQILIYPRLVQWACLWLGMRIRNQIRALMTAFLLVVTWCAVPLFIETYLSQTGLLHPQLGGAIRLVSPITVIHAAEALGAAKSGFDVSWSFLIMMTVHFAVAAGLMWRIRQVCLTNADRYLGRI